MLEEAERKTAESERTKGNSVVRVLGTAANSDRAIAQLASRSKSLEKRRNVREQLEGLVR